MKRGQLLSQPFIYIFAMVVIAVVIYFGFSMVSEVSCLGENVEGAKFVKDLNKHVLEINSFSTGTKNKYTLTPPADVRGLCFISKDYSLSNIPFQDIRVVVELEKEAGSLEHNMFFSLMPGSKKECLPENQLISRLVVEKFVCFDFSREPFEFILEKKGKVVYLSKLK